MAIREVRETCKDTDGDIKGLCNPGSFWSPRLSADVIRDIESGEHRYIVPWTSGPTEVEVVNDPQKGKYLRTRRDGSTGNNLDELPDCSC